MLYPGEYSICIAGGESEEQLCTHKAFSAVCTARSSCDVHTIVHIYMVLAVADWRRGPVQRSRARTRF
eukprot:SAG31_NODE_2369_length_5854_cov_3.778454_5_plen_68_part_00